MKINIKRKDIIKGAALIAGGILIGALLFSASGDKTGDKQIEVAEEHAHDEQAEGETTWTCSMHPQVRQDEPGDCPICGMELIPAEETDGDGSNQGPGEFNMTETAMKLANIQTSTVKKEKPEKEILLTGKIKIDERLINDELEVIATDHNGQIMAVAHKKYDVCGVQFHPESVMTPEGATMLKNWIER